MLSKAETLLPEFDIEMANTRKVLERVPEDKLDWQPHEKSPNMGWLATHLANLPTWVNYTLTTDSIDVGSPEMAEQRPQPVTSRQELLEQFDGNVARAREALAGASDEILMQLWTLLYQGATIFTMPRIAVLRTMVMSHIIHHRAQLGVYLRLNDIPVPGIYGPTADEPM